MTRTVCVALGVLILVVTGCRSPPDRTEAGILEAGFDAIRAGDWEAYKKWTVTTADFVMKETGQNNPFVRKQTFAGAVLKPEERVQQKADFEMAVRGGPGQLDFQHTRFAAPILVNQGDSDTLSGGKLAWWEYAVQYKKDGAVVDGKDMFPHFIVVKWNGRFRLLALAFPPPPGSP